MSHQSPDPTGSEHGLPPAGAFFDLNHVPDDVPRLGREPPGLEYAPQPEWELVVWRNEVGDFTALPCNRPGLLRRLLVWVVFGWTYQRYTPDEPE